MADWLSEEWAKEVAGYADLLPDIPGADGTISLAVTGPGKREISVHWQYQKGSAGGGAAGAASDPDLTLLITSDDAAQVLSGEVEPSVAFMRGRLKATGDGGLLLGFLASTNTAQFGGWRKKVAAVADETAR